MRSKAVGSPLFPYKLYSTEAAQPRLRNQGANLTGTECVEQRRHWTGRQAWRLEGSQVPECCPSAGAGFGENHQEGCPVGVGSSSCSDSGLQVVQSPGHQCWGEGGKESREQSGLATALLACHRSSGRRWSHSEHPVPTLPSDKGTDVYSSG